MKKERLMDVEKRKTLIIRLQKRELLEEDYTLLVNHLEEGMPKPPRGKEPDKDDEDGDKQDQDDNKGDSSDDEAGDKQDKGDSEDDEAGDKQEQEKRKGHGRLGSSDYTGAENRHVPHESYSIGDLCPCCGKGRLYGLEAKELINLIAYSPIIAIRYILAHLRCASCQKTFTASLPDDVSPDKYQPSANAAVVLMNYALGVPAKRLETWQQHFGVPLPDATQFNMREEVADCFQPVFRHFEALAADSWLFHLDDTSMRVLSLIEENKALQEGERYGMNATAILAYHEEHPIYLYYVGRKHAGDNLDNLLEKRTDGLPVPLQMGDASSCNTKHDHETIPIYCNSHAFRKFKDTAEAFDWESTTILSLLGGVFKNDTATKAMTAEERLAHHQEHSAPLMNQLYVFMTLLLKKELLEPKSTLAKAMKYMLKRWPGFTCFLRIPGAPLDNNVIERALKLMIRFRKNALFFKNEVGAWIGSLLTSILTTTTAAGANPMDYLQAVQIHRRDVAQAPQLWCPWNYRDRLAQLAPAKASA